MTINAFDSKSPAYVAIYDALGGFRTSTAALTALVSEIILSAEKVGTKAKIADLPALVLSLPVAVAGIGATTLAAIADGSATLPEPGDNGFVLSLVGVRGIDAVNAEGKAEKRNGALGLALYPAHSIDAYLATQEGRDFLAGIADKEAGLIAFRGLRFDVGAVTLDDIAQAAQGMPVLLSDFTDRTRTSTAESFAIFNDHWVNVRAIMAANPATTALVAALPTKKADVLAAIRSKSYAATLFPVLESGGHFVNVARIVQAVMLKLAATAEEEGKAFEYDLTAIGRWVAGRDTLDLLPKAADASDLGAIDLSAFGLN